MALLGTNVSKYRVPYGAHGAQWVKKDSFVKAD